ncbi:MAG: FG-GAP repeat protein [Alphaproteobacteria bacterium]|nr:FG-GAP repeat protein [Alphaproteobacteria bacterium]OJV47126.1 MAG: hypothetical protein BGO28_01630 [Alphaproteobacteria bacterium 43-37]
MVREKSFSQKFFRVLISSSLFYSTCSPVYGRSPVNLVEQAGFEDAGRVHHYTAVKSFVASHNSQVNRRNQQHQGLSSPAFPAVFNLSSLDGQNGFILNGFRMPGSVGYSVSAAGDVNGDGIDDIIIGAPYVAVGIGQAYVVFGNKGPFNASFDLRHLNGQNGFILDGFGSELTGVAVSQAGDINGDGISDVIVGAPATQNNVGQAYVVYGNKVFPSLINSSSLNGINGFTFIAPSAEEYFGTSVSSAGDVNGDGMNDIIIGSPYAGAMQSGQAYVVYGTKTGFNPTFNVSALNGNNGFTLDLDLLLYAGGLGYTVSSAGDINGDGVDDLVLGAQSVNNFLGQTYVVFGNPSGFRASFDLSALNGQNGFAVVGAPGFSLGYSVDRAGDVNGDGLSDIIIGATGNAGQVYVVFGQKNGFNPVVNVSDLNGYNGFAAVPGYSHTAQIGSSVGYAGDINRDGFSDILIGNPNANNRAGQAYVIYGHQGAFDPIVNVSTLNGTNGFTMDGVFGRLKGWSVSTAGDVNDDGVADILIGAPGDFNGLGQAYVVFGL